MIYEDNTNCDKFFDYFLKITVPILFLVALYIYFVPLTNIACKVLFADCKCLGEHIWGICGTYTEDVFSVKAGFVSFIIIQSIVTTALIATGLIISYYMGKNNNYTKNVNNLPQGDKSTRLKKSNQLN